ncbi:MAG: hypothetical protein ACI8V2_002530 [Candidatus Latescibacterota bacterium]|jgi:hypothetical protein
MGAVAYGGSAFKECSRNGNSALCLICFTDKLTDCKGD